MRNFLRRVHPTQVVYDENKKEWRASSAAFRDEEMSCDDENKLHSMHLNWKATLEGYEGYSLVRLSELLVLSNSLSIVEDPIINIDAENLAHVLIKGKKRKPITNNLKEGCEPILIVLPQPVPVS
ncbi:hypothetical protein [Acetobacter malorum]|uniref:hypothetical protein n=1 Tax=Acetobacter malorum TaxID=178901 RepID=UPI001C4F6FF8|nr:hypothetical protein [Acetobacter malorum]